MSITFRAVAQAQARHGPERIGGGPWISPDTGLQPSLRDSMTLANGKLTDVCSARYHTLYCPLTVPTSEKIWSAFLHERIPRQSQKPLDMSMFRKAQV